MVAEDRNEPQYCDMCHSSLTEDHDIGYVYVNRTDWDKRQVEYNSICFCWQCWGILSKAAEQLHEYQSPNCVDETHERKRIRLLGLEDEEGISLEGGPSEKPDFMPEEFRRYF
jgi:hypothetical protein